ncbi:beta-lactamase [Erythrobacter sp. SG61-1L]|uniref:serine hydrolase domain-containing protein n=1 Tax=Erythrobacter sp. SG61-1L TaxID=1603897 RepID=UPI0006C9190D|nr:serine hydrolase [Erythrobacter sp. SG61-1L]KPL69026.1 beta-lactamase [Erythrobacter sp. SG61-1L]
MKRPLLSIASLALLPAPLLALAACGGGSEEPAATAPLSEAALDAVVADPGAPREQLARRIDHLFTGEGMGETRAVIVMQGGRIVAERYGEGYGEETRFISWSMAKTVTGVMIGMLVADGKLQLDETPPIPNWRRTGDPRGAITLRQLLQMRSGLRHTESGDPAYEADTVKMLFLQGRDDMAAWAEAQPLEAKPGTHFEYSTNTTVILADIAARVLTDSTDPETRRKAVDDYLKARIFVPLGMYSMVPEYDRAGTLIGGSLIHGTARDWARFGEFLRHQGAVKGAQLVPKGWITFMTTPSPRSPDYGAQIWLNRPSETDRNVLFAARGPSDLYSMVGHLGQYVMVSPRQGLTVVRLGKTDDAIRDPLVAALGDVVALFPVRK